jgi:hypothetical protein
MKASQPEPGRSQDPELEMRNLLRLLPNSVTRKLASDAIAAMDSANLADRKSVV